MTAAAQREDPNARLRRLERRWQNEIGHALLDKPFEVRGARLVFERQFERVANALGVPPEGPIVEVGCGRGQFLAHLAGAARTRGRFLVGVDVSISVVALASIPAAAVRADGEELPFSDESVAALVYNGALHHVVDYRKAVREAFRVLRPGGRLVIFEPSSSLFSRVAHRVLDPIVFRASVEYESPVDQELKHAFDERAVVQEIRAQGAVPSRAVSDFLAYPVTGCYAGSLLTKSPALMRGLIALEGMVERAPVLSAIGRALAWRFLLVADKPGTASGAAVARTRDDLLRCPRCHGDVVLGVESVRCSTCRLAFRVEDGVPVLLLDEATPL